MKWRQRLWHRRKLDEQLEKELRFHIDQHAADLIEQGSDPEQAYRRARLDLGGPEQVKEECRDARGVRWLEDLWQDASYALRALRQRPGFAAVALLTLSLGTGATTVMFTVINGVLLKPLAFPQPDRLLVLREKTEQPTQFGYIWSFAYPNFLDCRREVHSLAPLVAWRDVGGVIADPGDPAYVSSREISAELFSVLGTPLFRGRTFLPEEDRPGGAPVAIISYGLWQRRFGASPDAIGRRLVFKGQPYTITGIAPAGFRLDDVQADLYTPLGQNSEPRMQNRQARVGLNVYARLPSGVTASQAQSELTAVGGQLARQYPDSNRGRSFVVQPLRPDVDDVRSTLWLLLGAVSFVLLIACVNVASLLLARAVSRERELAMRVALGAGRGRLIRQCLTESAVLGLAGGLLGILLATAGIRPFVTFWPGSLPRAEEIHLDWRVLLFALLASLLCGLLFGLAPALRAPARMLEQALRAGGRSVTGNSRRVHSGFVMSEIALAVVLLVSAGMLGRTLLHLSALDPGIDIHNVLVGRMALAPAAFTGPAQIRAAWKDVLAGMRRVPGVVAVAMVDTVPMRTGDNELGYWPAAAVPPRNEQPLALATSVTPDYLKVMGIPLRRGRFFDEQDRLGSELVIVIDDVLAQHAFGARDPVGQRIWMPDMDPGPVRVIGVVGHVRQWGFANDDRAQVRAQVYYPFAQVPDRLLARWSDLMSIAVRTGVPPLNMAEPLRREARGAGNDQVIYAVFTMEQLASGTLARQRFLLLLFGIFAALALALASIGIYGVMAYLTGQRTPEIGVRMALGATSHDVLRMVLQQSLGMIFAGIAAGAVAAFVAGRVLQQFVAGMQPAEVSTFVLMVSVLVLAALIASFIPARRASRVDPIRALRQE